jgi:hypothetical protein
METFAFWQKGANGCEDIPAWSKYHVSRFLTGDYLHSKNSKRSVESLHFYRRLFQEYCQRSTYTSLTQNVLIIVDCCRISHNGATIDPTGVAFIAFHSDCIVNQTRPSIGTRRFIGHEVGRTQTTDIDSLCGERTHEKETIRCTFKRSILNTNKLLFVLCSNLLTLLQRISGSEAVIETVVIDIYAFAGPDPIRAITISAAITFADTINACNGPVAPTRLGLSMKGKLIGARGIDTRGTRLAGQSGLVEEQKTICIMLVSDILYPRKNILVNRGNGLTCFQGMRVRWAETVIIPIFFGVDAAAVAHLLRTTSLFTITNNC